MQKNITKSAMHSGLIMGLLFSVNFLFSIAKIPVLQFLTYIIAGFILVGMHKMSVRYRDMECDGAISYGKAFLFILLTFFYAALISTVVKFVYFQFIKPSYLELMFQETMKMMEMLKIPMDDAAIKQMEGLLKPASFSLIFIWTNIVMGSFVGLIMAAFVKKEKSIFEEKSEKE